MLSRAVTLLDWRLCRPRLGGRAWRRVLRGRGRWRRCPGFGARSVLVTRHGPSPTGYLTAVAPALAVAQSSATAPELQSAPKGRRWCRRRGSRYRGKTPRSLGRQ